MYAIGKAAELCGTTVRAVRYYDEIGLLRPTEIKAGGRRYYSKEATVKLDTIITMKDLGFSLEYIGRILKEQPDSPKELLRMRLEMIDIEQKKLHQLKKQINATLQIMDMEDVESWQEIARIHHSLLQVDGEVASNRDIHFTETEKMALHELPLVGDSELGEAMAALVKDIYEHMDAEPQSEIGEQLAWRWLYLTDCMYKGNWDLANKAWQISQYDGENIGIYHYDTQVISFITKAIDSFFRKRLVVISQDKNDKRSS